MATIAKLVSIGFSPNEAKHLGNDSEYHAEIASWTPTLTFSGGMTCTGQTAAGSYARVGKFILATVQVTGGTLATAAGTDVYITLPVAAKSSFHIGGGCWWTDNGGAGVGHFFRQSDTLIGVRKTTVVNWALGAGFAFSFSFFYEAAAGVS